MLSWYGYSVAVMESHYAPGGAAHGYTLKRPEGEFQFDTGPSFFSGINPTLPAKSLIQKHYSMLVDATSINNKQSKLNVKPFHFA